MGIETSDVMLVTDNYVAPLDEIAGFPVRPGFFSSFGATLIPGGVNFTVQSHEAYSCELLLFHRMAKTPYAILKFPENYKIGFVYSMIVFGLDIEEFEYAYRLDGPYDEKKGLRFDKTQVLLDPYAKAITGQSKWGCRNSFQHGYRARVVRNNFDWGVERHSQISMEDMVIYEMHVRGFTNDISAGAKYPGTFKGVEEKIPYLKELGINTVELMPVFEFDEMRDARLLDNNQLLDYWGYNPVCFFAPNTSYTSSIEYNREGKEFKELIKALHDNGIDVILDVVFNHTAEGNEYGPCFSFKGFDNHIYYMLTPDGQYYNFSGCGNTLNCNHPVVQQMILDCLRYWVTNYRVDGFRFDLASILGRNDDGSPLSQPPLLRSLAFDPILGTVKLIAEAWDAGGLYQVGSFPSWKRWAEWNGKYRDDLRKFLKGDSQMAQAAATRILGSLDLYDPESRGLNASINFLTCHDGFTLYDLYAYNEKHNEANGWSNTDGANDNNSWNCGVEGDTENIEVLALRQKMICNACAVLMCSRGTPMFLSGDEFGDTRFGNNNPYCQDNLISWLDWGLLNKNKALFDFFRFMIGFRKKHPSIRRNLCPSKTGFPYTSEHGLTPWNPDYSNDSRTIGLMFAGYDEDTEKDDIVYIAINTYWRAMELMLPVLPVPLEWHVVVNTGDPVQTCYAEEKSVPVKNALLIGGRSVIVLTAR